MKIKKTINEKDEDYVLIVDGPEGAGKSTLAMQIAYDVDPDFNIDRVCMNPVDLHKAIVGAKRGQSVVYDEAYGGLSARATLSEINKLLVSLMMEMRQKNLFVIIILPTFFMLDRYVALFRARSLLHVYRKKGKRGMWVLFTKDKKKLLYILGKKTYSYAKPRSGIVGKFMAGYIVDEKKYRDKKAKALHDKDKRTKADKYILQRNIALYLIYKKAKMTQREMVEELNTHGFDLKLTQLSDTLRNVEESLFGSGNNKTIIRSIKK